jgi:dTDP-4-amino-4,6-dideoxy-D-galactose acyltransferase
MGAAMYTSTLSAADLRTSVMEWETSLFGRKIGRLEGLDTIVDVHEGAAAVHRAVRDAEISGFSVVMARVTGDRVTAAWALERAGFLTVDTGVTFAYDLAKDSFPVDGFAYDGLVIRPATAEDLPALQEMVTGLFLSSYYYVSPCFSNAEADLVYRTWMTNCVCHGRADRVLVAEVSGATAGFITCRRAEALEGVIDLVGVSPSHGSRGIAKALVKAALACFRELGAATVRVRTQVTNAAAVNLYAATGSRLVAIDTTLIKSLS